MKKNRPCVQPNHGFIIIWTNLCSESYLGNINIRIHEATGGISYIFDRPSLSNARLLYWQVIFYKKNI